MRICYYQKIKLIFNHLAKQRNVTVIFIIKYKMKWSN
jgi:hypothetical protein